MNKIVFCALFFAAAVWANPSVKWSAFNFDKGFFEADTSKYCVIDTVHINCMDGSGLAYYSMLDTNFAVFFYAKSKALIKGTQDAVSFSYRHNAIQVFRYEFMKWQEWGVLGISKDSAQFLIDKFVPEDADVEGTYWIKPECLEDMSQCRAQVEWGAATDGSLSSAEAALLPEKKILAEQPAVTQSSSSSADAPASQPAESAASESSSSKEVPPADESSTDDKSSADDESSSSADASIDSSKTTILVGDNSVQTKFVRGMRYKVFDMNGVFLRSGVWSGSVDSYGYPAILKFANGETLVVR